MPPSSEDKPRVRVADVAKRLGLAIGTVSKALHGLSGVSNQTRRKIVECAKEMGYHPDPALSALVAYRHAQRLPSGYSQLAFVTNFQRPDSKWSYVKKFYEGARERGRDFGYEVIDFPLRKNGSSQKEASSILFNRGIKGLIIAPLPTGRAHLNLTWDRFASVAIGKSLARPSLHYVTYDFHHSMRLVLHKLKNLSYSRIGLICWERENARSHHIEIDTYQGEQRRFPHGGADIPPFVARGENYWDNRFRERIREWLQQYSPDVIVTSGILAHYISTSGLLSDQENIGLACYGTTPKSDPTFSGIVQDLEAIGAVAVERLHAQLLRHEFGIPPHPQGTLVQGVWRDGSTVWKQPAPRANTGKRRKAR